MIRALLILVVLAVLGAAAGLVVLYTGVYNVAATQQHTAPVFWALETALKQSVERRADDVVPPDLTTDMAERGLLAYQEHCVQCHGAPGIPPQPFSKGMRPAPTNLVHSARMLSPAEVFWFIKYGIKMTGMPAWDYRMGDDEIWEIVALVERLPELVPDEYEAMVRTLDQRDRDPQPREDTGAGAELAEDELGDPEQGRRAILQYGCISCHIVPGIVGRDVRVGPSLGGIGDRKYIAGVLPNTPGNMVSWLQAPESIDPLTAMPDMGVTPAHARDMAAYLYSLEAE